MYCTNAFKNNIRGDHNSAKFNYVNIAIKGCKPTKKQKCAGKAEVRRFFRERENYV